MSDTFMGQAKKSWKFLIILFVLGGLFGSSPYIVARTVAGPQWQGVVPELIGDSLNYTTRANEAIHRGVMVGNPYYMAVYYPPAPSFSIADAITGIPYAFLSPFGAAFFDAFFWNGLLALFFGVLLLSLGYTRMVIVVFFCILESSIFGYMIRATNMQTVFPFFLLFFILLLRAWQRDRLNMAGKYDALLLGSFAGFMVYVHTFSFQVVAVSLAVGTALAFLLRRMRLARSLATSIGVMIAFTIPYFVYFYGIKDFPAFPETMNFFLGVRSHFPSPLVYFYGRWMLLLFAWSFLLWRVHARGAEKGIAISEEGTRGPSLEDVLFTIATVSLAIPGVMMQNIITGVDIAGPSHTKYIADILLPLSLALLVLPTLRVIFARDFFARKALLFLFALLVLIKVLTTIPTQFPPAYVYSPDSPGTEVIKPAGSPQYIMPALQAIRSLPGIQVVAAPAQLNAYIPLYTGQYVLYDSNGGSFGAGILESADRSFVSHLGAALTQEEVAKAFDEIWQGTGSELDGRNRLARELCTAVFHSPSCATVVVARYFSGDGVIDRALWFDYYQKSVRPNVVQYLHRFNVSQVVIDRRLSAPEFLRKETPWYSDQYYAIYDVTSL